MHACRNLSFVGIAALLLAGSSCLDPVHDDAVDALGPERRGVYPGPSHRPGQPCRTCHGGQGPSALEFSIAGTIFSAEGIPEPIEGVIIQVEDSVGSSYSAVSNEVGNFYIALESYAPVYPVSVELQDRRADKNGRKAMVSKIGRAGDCATCHFGAVNEPTHMPPVYLRLKAL